MRCEKVRRESVRNSKVISEISNFRTDGFSDLGSPVFQQIGLCFEAV